MGTVRFLVEIRMWAKKRFHDQLPLTVNDSNEAIRAISEQVALTTTSSNPIMAMLPPPTEVRQLGRKLL